MYDNGIYTTILIFVPVFYGMLKRIMDQVEILTRDCLTNFLSKQLFYRCLHELNFDAFGHIFFKISSRCFYWVVCGGKLFVSCHWSFLIVLLTNASIVTFSKFCI